MLNSQRLFHSSASSSVSKPTGLVGSDGNCSAKLVSALRNTKPVREDQGQVSPFSFVKLTAWAAPYEAKCRWKTRLIAGQKDTWSSTRTHQKVPHCSFLRSFPHPFQQHQMLVAVRYRMQGDGPSMFRSGCHSNPASPERRNSARTQRKAGRTIPNIISHLPGNLHRHLLDL